MLDSFLNEFSFIRDTIEKDGDHNFFENNFSFFSAEPILFYNNAKDVIVYANSMFTKEFNYTVQDLAEWNYSILPLLNTQDQEPFRLAMKSLLEGDELTPNDTTYRLISKGKKYGYYRVKVRKLHKSYYYIQLENAARLAIPVLKNNTADELMQNAEAILQFGFWMWDFTFDKLYWTRGMYQLLEYDGEDEAETLAVTPELYSSHVLTDAGKKIFDREFFEDKINNAYNRKYQVKTNKGNLLTVSEHGNVEYDEEGKLKRAMGIIRNITLQEESMKSLADYKSMMLENETFLNYGTWESDADGNNIYWSEGMYNIFGYTEAEKKDLLINKSLYLLHMNPEDAQAGQAKNIIDSDRNHYQWDYEIKDHQGNVKLLSTYGKIIRNNEGKVQKIIGTTKDVTELREYERTLESKIMELNRSNRELEEFAYVASHDLQEPLRKISTFGQRLQLRFSDKLGADGNLYIDRMIGACENMRNLIGNLLEFSRISLNKSPAELISLGDIVKQTIEGLDLIIAETNATITVSQLPKIEGIGSQLLQLFSNILNNSIKFRNENVPLVINIQSRKLLAKEKMEYELEPSATFYIITIKDNGVGFEQQYAHKIFQVFQRLQGKSEYPGTGIGLSICKKIVTNHKGLIFANSEPGEGALFSIILPQQQ